MWRHSLLTLRPTKHPWHPCLVKHRRAPGPWAWPLWQHQRWKRDTCHLGPGLSQGPSWPAAHASTASEKELDPKAMKDNEGSPRAHKPLRTTRPVRALLGQPCGMAAPTLPGSASTWCSGSPAWHCSCSGDVHAAWPSPPLAISNLGWVDRQRSFVAFCFGCSVFPHKGWLKSTKRLTSNWVSSDCQRQGLLASDLLHSCCGNKVYCITQTTGLLTVHSGLF